MEAGLRPPAHVEPRPAPAEGGFCPRGYRRTRRVSILAWAAGAATVFATLAIYFLDAEPAIRAYSAEFDLRFTVFIVVMLALGFSQIPLQTRLLREPRSVSASPEGLTLVYDSLTGSRERRVPWSRVKRIAPGPVARGETRTQYTLVFSPGKRGWLAEEVAIEPEVVRAWTLFLPRSLRPAPAPLA